MTDPGDDVAGFRRDRSVSTASPARSRTDRDQPTAMRRTVIGAGSLAALRMAADGAAVALAIGGLFVSAGLSLDTAELATVLGLLILANAVLTAFLAVAAHPFHAPAPSGLSVVIVTTVSWLGACAVVLLPLAVSGSFAADRPGTVLLVFPVGAGALLAARILSIRFEMARRRQGRLVTRSAIVVRLDPHRPTSNALPRLGIAIAAEIDHPDNGDDGAAARTLIDTIRERIATADVTEILVLGSPGPALNALREALREVPLPVNLLPDHATARLVRGRTGLIGRRRTFELQRAPLDMSERLVKRTVDILGAGTLLVALSPLLLTVSVLIALDSPGPVLFRQHRIGFCGRRFAIFKFRSMRVTENGDDVVQARQGDARVTRVGRWLRRSSVDELPQLLNVLRGDMSLVGPRPHALAHDAHYSRIVARYAARHHLPPGITGWAQVNGWRGETPTPDLMERRVEHDLWYIRHWSLALDLRILLMTFGALARPQRAY